MVRGKIELYLSDFLYHRKCYEPNCIFYLTAEKEGRKVSQRIPLYFSVRKSLRFSMGYNKKSLQ